MKKLTLTMDHLRVETFTTGVPTAGTGTVQAHYGTNHTLQGCFTGDYTCDGWMTFKDGQQVCEAC
jgi:hypothetical protein